MEAMAVGCRGGLVSDFPLYFCFSFVEEAIYLIQAGEPEILLFMETLQKVHNRSILALLPNAMSIRPSVCCQRVKNSEKFDICAKVYRQCTSLVESLSDLFLF